MQWHCLWLDQNHNMGLCNVMGMACILFPSSVFYLKCVEAVWKPPALTLIRHVTVMAPCHQPTVIIVIIEQVKPVMKLHHWHMKMFVCFNINSTCHFITVDLLSYKLIHCIFNHVLFTYHKFNGVTGQKSTQLNFSAGSKQWKSTQWIQWKSTQWIQQKVSRQSGDHVMFTHCWLTEIL